MTVGGLGRRPHPETRIAAQLHPVRSHSAYRTTTTTFKYWWQNGVWLDQGQTGTCVGNALAHRRADSPQPTPGIDEVWARELYVAASGDDTLQQGTSAILACRVLAKRGVITGYNWITTPDELRNAVLTVGAVCVGTDWFASMSYPEGNRMIIDYSSGLVGGHEYVINGINLDPRHGPAFYRAKNSWGRTWGYHGNARIVCSELEVLLFTRNGDAVVLTEAI